MKKFWLVTIVSLMMLFLVPLAFGLHKANAAPGCTNTFENQYFQQDCSNLGYWLPYCGTNNEFKQFDRCANESFYLKQEQKIGLFDNARWIWQFGHDGDYGIPDISSANGTSTSDMSGFVNVIRNDLYDSYKAGFGYLYLSGRQIAPCGEQDATGPNGTFYNQYIWCEIDAAAALGASQIINNMMGFVADNPAFDTNSTGQEYYKAFCNGSTSGWSSKDRRINGIGIARCVFPQWKQLVEYYASQPVNSSNGWVDWNNTADLSSCRTDAVVYRDVVGYNIADPNSLDTGSYINCSVDTVSRYIVFYNPGGIPAFRINKNCGNLTGPLMPIVFNGQFKITPQPGAVSLTPTNENVSSATFPSNYSVDADLSGTSLSSTVKRTFYIDPYAAGADFTLGTKTDTISGNQLTAGQHSLSTETVNNILYLYPSLNTGDKVCQTMTINPGTGSFDFHSNTANGTGLTSPPSPSCAIVEDKPYVKFFGGDVYAGGGFKDGSGCVATSSIDTFKDGNKGSSAQFAATALGGIPSSSGINFGLSTANLGTSSFAQPPNGLTFANIPAGTVGNFGKCTYFPDYWSTSASATAYNPGASVFANSIPSGALKYSGNLTINGGFAGVIAAGTHAVLYVDGNVTIANDIVYAYPPYGNVTSEKDIPYLIIIAKGNIYINNTVKQLSGIFIAQGDGTGNSANGNIYTCTNGSSLYPKPTTVADATPFITKADGSIGACAKNRLTVFGAFVARKVNFLRTSGSLRNSINPETYLDSSTKASETFVISPEMYAGAAGLCSAIPTVCSASSYDSVGSLPPVL